jgi:hypothetical protein
LLEIKANYVLCVVLTSHPCLVHEYSFLFVKRVDLFGQFGFFCSVSLFHLANFLILRVIQVIHVKYMVICLFNQLKYHLINFNQFVFLSNFFTICHDSGHVDEVSEEFCSL